MSIGKAELGACISRLPEKSSNGTTIWAQLLYLHNKNRFLALAYSDECWFQVESATNNHILIQVVTMQVFENYWLNILFGKMWTLIPTQNPNAVPEFKADAFHNVKIANVRCIKSVYAENSFWSSCVLGVF